MVKYPTENERFKHLVKNVLELKAAEMARQLEMSPGHITSMSNGARALSGDVIKALFHEMKVNPLWLIGGIGPIILNGDDIGELQIDDNIEQKVKDSRKDIPDKLHMSHSEEVARLQEQVAMLNKLLDAKEEHLEDLRAVVRHYQQTDSDSEASEEDTSGDIALAS